MSQEPPLASLLVARFLRANNYTQTLDAFIREAGLPPDAGQPSGKDKRDERNWTIEGVLEEKRVFDQSIRFERLGEEQEDKDEWSLPAPTKPTVIQTPTSSNLLSCSVETWRRPTEEEESNGSSSYVTATAADRQLHLFRTTAGNEVVKSFAGQSESPILSYVPIKNGRYALMTNMSGQFLLQRGPEILDRRKDHSKYAVKVVAYESDDGSVLIATAGWDSNIFLYRLSIPNEDADPASVVIGEPVSYIHLASNPESMLFVSHRDTKEPILLVSRRDSTHLYYYQVQKPSDPPTTPYECTLLGKQNLAPHSNAWVAFSPSCLALSPHDPTLLAVATSALPHMKLIIVRLLFPSPESLDLVTGGAPIVTAEAENTTQATQALAALSLQNREDAAIEIQANTFAPQTAYSTPQVVWRPDGSGLWVNGDDGVIRGVERKTGKVVALLKDGHEIGYKVRSIWAGWVDVSRDGGEVVREEWLVSGGFDKRLIVWRVGSQN